jgi:hypothetical protein
MSRTSPDHSVWLLFADPLKKGGGEGRKKEGSKTPTTFVEEKA